MRSERDAAAMIYDIIITALNSRRSTVSVKADLKLTKEA